MINVKYLRTLFYMIMSHLFLYQCSQNCQDRFSVTEANESIDLENDLNNPKKEKSVIMQLKKETLPTLSQNSNLFANILNTKDFNKINAALMQNDKKAKDGAKDLAFKKIKNGKCTLEILLENVLGSNGEKNNKYFNSSERSKTNTIFEALLAEQTLFDSEIFNELLKKCVDGNYKSPAFALINKFWNQEKNHNNYINVVIDISEAKKSSTTLQRDRWAAACNTMIASFDPKKIAHNLDMHKAFLKFEINKWEGYDLIKDKNGTHKKRTSEVFTESIKNEKIDDSAILEFYKQNGGYFIQNLKYEGHEKFYSFIKEKFGHKILTPNFIKQIADKKSEFSSFLFGLLDDEKNIDNRLKLFGKSDLLKSGNILSYCAANFSENDLHTLVGKLTSKDGKASKDLKSLIQVAVGEKIDKEKIKLLTAAAFAD